MKKMSFCLSLILSCLAYSQSIPYPDFDRSMLSGVGFCDKNYLIERTQLYNSCNLKFLELFKKIYYENISLAEQENNLGVYRIPRIVHQIWLGPKPYEQFHCWMKTWANLAGWEYKLWTDDDVKLIQLHNKDLYDISENYGEKTDILRLEILQQFGGVYVDVDYECYRPEFFNDLHRGYDFYIGFEPPEHGFINRFNMFKVCNAIIGSAPQHPLLKEMIDNLKANYLAYRNHGGAVLRTGPSYLTRIVCSYEQNRSTLDRNIYLPCSILYPFNQMETKCYFASPNPSELIYPETAGIHYWCGSWIQNPLDPSYYCPTTKENL